MDARLCRYTDYFERRPDGEPVLTLEAVAVLNEILMVRSENEYRAHKYAEAEARRKSPKGKR